ncbi:hypothetical protein Zmor_014875 [Zophobas morio]|uniref:Uncharacterized protein n=1 Tax=Zophobas morio TaxID=2755281 RepID=A0AA38MGR4_9CUCU|nr:hypothetical protein Zmor_014875 [Zophobas morio]
MEERALIPLDIVAKIEDYQSRKMIPKNQRVEAEVHSKQKDNEKDLELVIPKKKSRAVKRPENKNKNYVIGTNQSEETSSTLLVAPKKAFWYVSRLRPGTTVQQVVDFLNPDFPEVRCEPIDSKYPQHYSSFKVIVNLANKDNIMDPNIWPQETYVARFFHRKAKTEEGGGVN